MITHAARLGLISLLVLAGCGGGSNAPGAGPDWRVLGIHASEASDGDFDAAVNLAVSAGARALHLHLDWSGLEGAPETYDATFPDIANIYYPARGIPLYLTLRPINTVRREVPADLQNVAWDDPVMIQRFAKLLDFLFARMPDVDIPALAIGNEVASVLQTEEDYAAYRTFLMAARAHARTLRPGLAVGVTAQFNELIGASQARIATLNEVTDFVSVTYYPLAANGLVRAPSVVGSDFDAITAAYPGREVIIQECGYPSSPDTGSSETMQRDFVVAVFAAWDDHKTTISHIAFEHLHDWSEATVDTFTVYYGSTAPAFRGFLATIGLRNHDGTAKLAWAALVAGAGARGLTGAVGD